MSKKQKNCLIFDKKVPKKFKNLFKKIKKYEVVFVFEANEKNKSITIN